MVAICEVGAHAAAFRDRLEEVVRFDDLRFPVANAQSWNGPEAFSVRMGRAGVHGAESAAVGLVGSEADLQFIASFVVEDDAAFGSVDFEGDVVVPSVRVACRLHGSHGSVGEADHRHDFIVDIYLAPRTFPAPYGAERVGPARLEGPLRDPGRQDGVDGAELADEVAGHVDDVSGDIAKGAGACN